MHVLFPSYDPPDEPGATKREDSPRSNPFSFCQFTQMGETPSVETDHIWLSYANFKVAVVPPRCGKEPKGISRWRFPEDASTEPISAGWVVEKLGIPVLSVYSCA